jgi:hypothetical protein
MAISLVHPNERHTGILCLLVKYLLWQCATFGNTIHPPLISRAQIGTPYRNPSSLGEVDGCFFGLILLCNCLGPFRLQNKRVRVCEILIREKNLWEDINMIEVYTFKYIRQKESTGWFFLKRIISSKELFFLIMFLHATCRHVFLCARVDTKQTE